MRMFQLIALTPPGLIDPSIAIAASRGGALGVLDLEFAEGEGNALAAMAKLAQYTKNGCGIKLDCANVELAEGLISRLPKQVEAVILTPSNLDVLPQQVRNFHSKKVTVLLETISLEQAIQGLEAGVDGLIAKGNEAGGWVGEETTFILLQHLLNRVSVPVWAQGGIGLHTSAACYVAGAAGVVLDSQLALTCESTLPQPVKELIARMDGSETTCLGSELDARCRAYGRSRLLPVEELRQFERTLVQDSRPQTEILSSWRQEVKSRVGWESPEHHILLFGQDVAMAASLAQRFRTVGGVLEGIRQATDAHVRDARSLRPLDEETPLARSHGTHYPIVQGPMTRVSDRASFAYKVSEAGGLPFIAFGLMRASELKELVGEIHQLLGDRPWGVGIIGFASPDLLKEQLDLIRARPPKFALIAGGLPEQASVLEQEGIATYLHVASPEMLKMFLENGARRFIFEGRECGGHIGPRSSFLLWNQMIDVLLESLPEDDATNCHVLFAGGIHDVLSSSMVATLAAPLAKYGIRVGILMGTAYLFTDEALTTGAIVKGFQQEALRCIRTVVLETGPGHASRSALTRYAETFKKEKQRLRAEGKSAEEIRDELENLNLGRLSIAAKGIKRNPKYGRDSEKDKYVTVRKEQQHAQGMYMIGQVATLRNRTVSIEELHHDVSVKGSHRLANLEEPRLSHPPRQRTIRPCDIAIIGMSCFLPKAPNLQAYWENIFNKIDAITEVPAHRWDWRLYYDQDAKIRDKVISKWGGFLGEVTFDPARYGIPPKTLSSIEPLQLLTLEAARAALEDAGYGDRAFPRERTSVILGAGGGISDLGQQYTFRANLPTYLPGVSEDLLSRLPEWTEDSFAGILLNVAAGRVANRLDLGGVNYTTDAACASSLAALYSAIGELENETSYMVLVGGADTFQNPFSYLCFSKSLTLTPNRRCRPFDASADGILLGEGIAFLVLKRLADAERDGDRIYGVIKGVGGSSDGRAKGLTAPRFEGQALALKRAYTKAGCPAASVELIEAHGTGTVAGDQVEIEVLKQLFEADGALPQSCAIGSVKSMIGHTKCTAGIAGLIKVALGLYHKVLPPTIGIERPNPILSESPLYVNTESRPWIHGENNEPRRAGVSSFGFGGTNFHTVLEEYTGNFLESRYEAVSQRWPSELFFWIGDSRRELLSAIEVVERGIARGAKPRLRDLAYTLWQQAKGRTGLRLAVIATSLDDLQEKLTWVRQGLAQTGDKRIQDPRGIYFAEEPLTWDGKIVFLFPGQGSQYPDMLRDLAIQFPPVREHLELAERVLSKKFPQPLGAYIYPPPRFSEEEERISMQALTQTTVAQPSIGAASMGLVHLLHKLGIKPNMVAGHSYGEYVALCAAGVFTEEVLYALSEARGRFIIERAEEDLGKMAAIASGPEAIDETLQSIEGVWIANMNSPEQTVISGTQAGIEEAVKRLEAKGMEIHRVPVSCAFHSPLMTPVQDRLQEFLSTLQFHEPQLEAYSNTTGSPYPQDPKTITALLSEHLVRPVQFMTEIEAMYNAGARTFIEVGPRRVLTNLTQQILGERPSLALSLDVPGRSGLLQLHHVLGQLAAHGVLAQLDYLYRGRGVRKLNLGLLVEETGEQPLPTTTWLIDGGRARPLHRTQTSGAQLEPSTQGETIHSVKVQASADSFPSHPAPASTNEDISPTLQTSETNRMLEGLRAADPNTSPQGPASSDSDIDQVMLQYQILMQRFLETQKQIMLTYLRGSAESEAIMPSAETSREAVTEAPESPTRASTAELEPNVSLGSAEHISMEESQAALNEEQLKGRLLQAVSERTGYPPDMLDLDLDLEADLGIDSIKRVEIVGALRKMYPHLTQGQGQTVPGELIKRKTLRGIIEWITSSVQFQVKERTDAAPSEQRQIVASQNLSGELDDEMVEVPRFLLTAVDAPLGDQPLHIPPGSVFLITDDERGISQVLAGEIRRLGGRVVLVQMGETVSETDDGLYTANLGDAATVAKFVEIVREHQGPIAGVVHLLPLKAGISFEDMSLNDWQARLRQDVKSLFYLARAAGGDLKRAPEPGAAWLIAATSMGRTFTNKAGKRTPLFPSHGGTAGLVKTIALEWPGVNCKVVAVGPRTSRAALTSHLLREMASKDGKIEVGYTGSRRLVLTAEPAPLQEEAQLTPKIDSDQVILITGGARGITAQVARELARRYRPTLLLAGRSPFPDTEEAQVTASLTSPRELKEAVMDQMQRRGRRPTPAQVEVAYKKLVQAREMRSNIKAMQDAGASVEYFQVDVRDENAFGNLIDDIYRQYARLDGVIHGAGIIEDKLLEDKLPESFDRVFDTKAQSAFILSKKLKPEALKFLVFFSSVSGLFGNPGQCDYAATNEVMNKVAVYLDNHWNGRIVSINWGPWAKTGMVSNEVQVQFAERGVEPIPAPAGFHLFDQEVRFGRKGEVEVIVGNGPWGIAGKKRISSGPSGPDTFPLLRDAELQRTEDGLVEVRRTLDVVDDRYLQDHVLDEKPVFPAAMAMELMAEVAKRGWPERTILGMEVLRALRGIILHDGTKDIRIVARPRTDIPRESPVLEVQVEIEEIDKPGRPCYQANVQLGDQIPAPPSYDLGSLSEIRSFTMTVEEAYQRWLFHGQSLQGISTIEGINEYGICAILNPSSPGDCLSRKTAGQWLIDPVVIDCSFQLAILWTRAYHDMTAIPSRFASYRSYGRLSSAPVRCCLRATSSDEGPILTANIYFLDPDHRLIGLMEGMEFSCSKALNRLARFNKSMNGDNR